MTYIPVGCEMLQAPVVVAHHKFLGFCVRPSAGRSGVAHISALQKGSYQPLVVMLSTEQQAQQDNQPYRVVLRFGQVRCVACVCSHPVYSPYVLALAYAW